MQKLISKYILLTILPYFFASWLLLIVILFVQQAGRYSDILFNASIPLNLIWQLTLALAPNIVAFTCPMAILVGTIIGFSKMQSDNELIILRAVGISNLRIIFPVFLIGLALLIFSFFVNLSAVPFAAKIIREVAVRTALTKLESPIEPGVFNTEIDGYTIYVRDGDIEKGIWKNIFIYNQDAEKKQSRLITSKNGRIDVYNDKSELVLSDAVVTTLPDNSVEGKFAAEKLGEVRLVIKSKRSELLEKLSNSEQLPDELGLKELAVYAQKLEGKEKIEAQILFYRKIILSITPLIFALLGAALILKFNRSGRGFGIFLALLSLVFYYLLVLGGEQLARIGKISTFNAGILPLAAGMTAVFWLSFSGKSYLRLSNGRLKKLNIFAFLKSIKFRSLTQYIYYRILDFDIILDFLKYFLLAFAFLCSIFVIFTSFELWKFAGVINNGATLLLKYLLYLLPFIYLQLAPASIMIAVLATYVIKSRQNEIITWTAAGQSIYRLIAPCLVLMMVLGFLNWELQERILPKTNIMQDNLRTQIRNKGLMENKTGKFWVANNKRIYSFDLADTTRTSEQNVKNLTVYDFSEDNLSLKSLYRSADAVWLADKIQLNGKAEKLSFADNQISEETAANVELSETSNPFAVHSNKSTHLNTQELTNEIKNADGESEKRNFRTALQKKYVTLLLPLIIIIFIAPFALSLSHKGKAATVGYAVGIWLLFMGLTNLFEQFGLTGYMSPFAAVWSPLFLFTIFGLYMLTRTKT